MAYNGNGSTRWRFLTQDKINAQTGGPPDGRSDAVYSSPAIGDVNGDGRNDIVFGSWDNKIYALNGNGTMVSGFPIDNTDTVFSSPALYDLDDDGRLEIVIGGDQTRNPAVPSSFAGGILRVLDWSNGVVTQRTRGFNDILASSPSIGDLDGNGTQDVAIGYGFSGALLLRGSDGALIRWVGSGAYASLGTPAIVDFGGGVRRLVVGGWDPRNSTFQTGQVAAFELPAGTADWPVFRKDPRHLGAPLSGGNPLPPGYCRRSTNPPAAPSPASGRGYWFLGLDGGVFSFDVPFYGSLPGIGVREQSLSMASRPQGDGYWIVSQSGRVFAFGQAPNLGDLAGFPLNSPVIRLVPTPSGRGYWLLAGDGGIFTFGDAGFFGSTGNVPLRAPVIGMASTATGRGYWLVASDGGVFTFGDAPYRGSTGGVALAAPIVSMAARPDGAGYWLLGGDGGVFSFGVPFYGSVPGTGVCRIAAPGVQMQATKTGRGYWIVGADGGVFTFGDALFHGSYPGLSGANRAVDLAIG